MMGHAAACVVVLLTAGLQLAQTSTSSSCDAGSFVKNAAMPCFTNWVPALQTMQITESPSTNLATFVTKISTLAGGNKTEINKQLQGFGFTMEDPLTYFAELVLTAEPYMAYMMADVIVGFELSAEDLDKLGLDRAFSGNRAALNQFYTGYYQRSCDRKPLESLLMCLKQWLDDNCVRDSCFIKTLLERYSKFYCAQDQPRIQPQLNEVYQKGLGHTVTPYLKGMGVTKDPQSQFVFSYDPSILISFQEKLRVTDEACVSKGSAFQKQVVAFQQKIQNSSSPENSRADQTTSLMDDIESLTSTGSNVMSCMAQSLMKQSPEWFSEEFRCTDAIAFARYGLQLRFGTELCTSMDPLKHHYFIEKPTKADCEANVFKYKQIPSGTIPDESKQEIPSSIIPDQNKPYNFDKFIVQLQTTKSPNSSSSLKSFSLVSAAILMLHLFKLVL